MLGRTTHSSVLAWRIPGVGEPGGLPSMGSHRVGHDWSDLAAAAAEQAGADGAAWTKMCNLVWLILALELPGQQWVAAPSWKGQVLWVPFCHSCFILSIVLEHKVWWSYYLIPVFVGICFTLPNLLYPWCLSSWERLTVVAQATFTLTPPHPCHHNQLPCMETSPPQWSKTLKLGRTSSCSGLRHCPRGLFCNILHWTTGRGGIFIFSGGDEGQTS